MRILILRLAIFAACLLAAFHADGLLDAAGLEPSGSARQWGSELILSLAWLAGAYAAIRAVDLFFWDGVVARIAGRPVPGLLKSTFAVVVVVVAITGVLALVFERDVTAIWATSGAIGIVFGFALRNMIQDVFMGIALNLDGAFKAGDWIHLHHRDIMQDQYGQVVDITWRTTRIMLEDDNLMVVPNSRMGSMAVTNFAHAGHISRLEIRIVLDFDVPPERARRILLAGARAVTGREGVQERPPPHVVIAAPNERGSVYKIRFWGLVSAIRPTMMRDTVMTSVLTHLRMAGVTPAYPKEDIYHAGLPKRMLQHDQREDRAEVLSRVDLFGSTMSAEELDELAAGVELTAFEPRQALVRQGDPGESMFVVVEGSLDVLVQRDDSAEAVRVGRIGAGEIFGEMSLLTAEQRSASVVAATGVVAYEVPRAPFEAILAARPELAKQISALVAERRLRTDEAMSSASQADYENECHRLSEQILERMKSVFVLVLGAPEGPRRQRS